MPEQERRSLITLLLLAALGGSVLMASIRIGGNAALNQTYNETERSPYFFVLHEGEDGIWRPSILEDATNHPTAYQDSAPTVSTPTLKTVNRFVLTPEALEQLEETRVAERAVWMESGVLLGRAPVLTTDSEGRQEIQIQLALGESSARFKYRVDPMRGELLPLQFGYFTKRVAFVAFSAGSIGAAALVVIICFVLDTRERKRTSRKMARGRAAMWVFTALSGIGAASFVYTMCVGLLLWPCFLISAAWLTVTRDTGQSTPPDPPITVQ